MGLKVTFSATFFVFLFTFCIYICKEDQEKMSLTKALFNINREKVIKIFNETLMGTLYLYGRINFFQANL